MTIATSSANHADLDLPSEETDSSKTPVRRQDLWEQALELRMKGWAYGRIAKELGIAIGTAHKYVQKAINLRIAEPTEHIMAIERERLDGLLQIVHDIIEKAHPEADGNLKLQAIDRFIKINERRARLLGLDQPVRVDQTTRVQVDYSIDGVDARAIIEGQVVEAETKAIEQ